MKAKLYTNRNAYCFLGLLGVSLVAHADAPIPLDRPSTATLTVQELPDHSQIDIDDYTPISGKWRLVNTMNGYRTWEAPLPVRPRSLFFERPPAGMTLIERRSKDQAWSAGNKRSSAGRLSNKQAANKWSFSAHSIQVRRSISAGPPPSWAYAVHYPKAVEREKELYFIEPQSDKELSIEPFARSLQFEDTTKHGLFISAPTELGFSLTVPDKAIFEAESILLPPEAADPSRKKTDGVSLSIMLIDANETAHSIYTAPLNLGYFDKIRIDLSRFAGQKVNLRIQTHARESGLYNHVFIADPIVRTPSKKPKTVVMIFIDTLRYDHLSMYGYHRPTTPRLDAWAKEATVYTNARSVAPWTLPSARTMMTGSHPERWSTAPTIQEHFAEQGWATAFIAGNIYLSSTFEMANGWGTHRCVNWPLAEVQSKRGTEFLDQNPDRDRLLMLHFMDMHLPYTEPISYRHLFAGERPKELKTDGFLRPDVVRAAKKMGKEAKQHVVDRYDNNLRYLDDVVSDFFETLPEDSVIAIFSDHGEEFWDHDDFEHGHTFYDELLRIPFIIKSPDLEASVIDDPISLLDLTPSLTRAAGLPDMSDINGWALQDAANKDFSTRPLAFGRPLYGDDGWASLYQDTKYIVRSGKEAQYNLEADSKEKKNTLKSGDNPRVGRAALQEALQQDVLPTLRIKLNHKRNAKDATVAIQNPTDIVRSWKGTDPAKRAPLELQSEGNLLSATWLESGRTSREIFYVPEGDIEAAIESLQATFKVGSTTKDFLRSDSINWPPPFKMDGRTLMSTKIAGRNATISYTIAPLPPEGYEDIDAFDDEVSAELKALGYIEE